MNLRRLGKTDIEISPIGLGCWQFSGGRGLVSEDLPQPGDEWSDAFEREAVREVPRVEDGAARARAPSSRPATGGRPATR